MYKAIYVNTEFYNKHELWNYPNAGANASIKGMKRKFWGIDAYILKHGAYIYKVPYSIYALACM